MGGRSRRFGPRLSRDCNGPLRSHVSNSNQAAQSDSRFACTVSMLRSVMLPSPSIRKKSLSLRPSVDLGPLASRFTAATTLSKE